jgi:hypothetical protein
MVLEYLLLFGLAMRPEREAASAIYRARSRRGDDLPIISPHSREELAAGFTVEEALLPIRFEGRKSTRMDADRYRTGRECESFAAHGNVHPPS